MNPKIGFDFRKGIMHHFTGCCDVTSLTHAGQA
jgi:hypothetical protein